MGKIKVVLSAIWYPVAIARYFQHALQKRKDVDLYVVGPYTGSSIPWSGGMFVDCPLPKPDLILDPMSNGRFEIKSIFTPWDPDVWIQVDAAYHLLGRPKVGKHFIIGTDPHCISYDYQRTQADVFFCMQTPYMKDGDVWLPYAYDTRWHSPLPNALNYDFGIVGVDGRQGPLYKNRDDLVRALRGKGYKVLQVVGKAYDDYRDLLSQCKVGLNWSTQLDTTARVFETMGMCVALLTNRTPDLDKLGFKDGRDYVGFDTLEEATQQADWLMGQWMGEGDFRWSMISEHGYKAVEREHTWDNRVERVLSYV